MTPESASNIEQDGSVAGCVQSALVDALRYRRLRTLGCAPDTWGGLEEGLVLRFTNLDDFVDRDLLDVDRNDSVGCKPRGQS